MRPICLCSFVIILICGEIVSNCFVDCSEILWKGNDQKLTLVGAVIAWSFLPKAIVAKKKSGSKTKERSDDKGNADKKFIDEILRKAEIAKSKKKEEDLGPVSDEPELDPIKCFPKALCGVSSEVEQISKRRKNGLITEYMILMKAVAQHPELMNGVVSSKNKGTVKQRVKNKKKSKDKDEIQQDLSDPHEEDDENNSDSEEDDYNESDEEEDDEEYDDEPEREEVQPVKKKKKKETIPKNDDEFHTAYLKEKVEMDKLFSDTLKKEEAEKENVWWDDGPTRPSFAQKRPGPGGYGGGYGGGGPGGPGPSGHSGPPPYFRGDPIPPSFPYEYGPQQGGDGNGGFTSWLTRLFGFGETSLTNDPWFPSAARDLSGEIYPGVAMDETRDILKTAIEIGKSFDKPSQCNEIFNACKYEYTELLHMIDDLRQTLRQKVQEAQDEESNQPSKKTKKEKAKSESEFSNSPPHKKAKTKKKVSRPVLISDEMSGESPDERYVIPVKPYPPPPYAEPFSFSNVLSWLGLGSNTWKGSSESDAKHRS